MLMMNAHDDDDDDDDDDEDEDDGDDDDDYDAETPVQGSTVRCSLHMLVISPSSSLLMMLKTSINPPTPPCEGFRACEAPSQTSNVWLFQTSLPTLKS